MSKWIVGIDEVGRGSLAGPVTVAAVAMFIKHRARNTKQNVLKGIRDSKKLTAYQRKVWNKIIRKNFPCTTASVFSKTVDKKGISYAIEKAVARCLEKLSTTYNLKPTTLYILMDGGLHSPAEYKNQKTIIRGDEIEPIISAASVVAKVYRDRCMNRIAKQFPVYEFEKHKGYGTKAHISIIKTLGLTPYHRVSFCRHR